MNECRIIEDLLPLFTEKLLQEDTNEFVRMHLLRCSACAEKEKKLLSAVSPPPVRDRKSRFRRVGRKIRRKTFFITAISLILAVTVFLSVYLPVQALRDTQKEVINEKNVVCSCISGAISGGRVSIGDEWVISSQTEENGIRVRNENFTLCLPDENFMRYDEGLFEWVEYGKPDSRKSSLNFYERENEIMWDEFENPFQDDAAAFPFLSDYYLYGEELLRDIGHERRIELAYYFLDFRLKSLNQDSSKESLAIGLFLASNFSKFCNFSTIRRLSGDLNGYCVNSEHGSWQIYLEDPLKENVCYFISLVSEKDNHGETPFLFEEETVQKLLASVIIL